MRSSLAISSYATTLSTGLWWLSMSTSSTWRGHDIRYIDDVWVYADTGGAVQECPDRPCGACKRSNRGDGHDACIGELAGVMNACCGHGSERDAYVQFVDGRRVEGLDALSYLTS